jgi:hypothetical protein
VRVCSFNLPCECQELQPVSSANLVSLRVDDRDAYAIADGIYSSIHVYARQPGADYSACLRRALGKILCVVCVLVIRGQQAGCCRKKNDPRKDHAKQRQEHWMRAENAYCVPRICLVRFGLIVAELSNSGERERAHHYDSNKSD